MFGSIFNRVYFFRNFKLADFFFLSVVYTQINFSITITLIYTEYF